MRLSQSKLRFILGSKLIGIYIHSSVAQNAFRGELRFKEEGLQRMLSEFPAFDTFFQRILLKF